MKTTNERSILDEIRAGGHKMTKARKGLAQVLETAKEPLTVAQLMARLDKLGVSADKTTIYREMEFFASLRLVNEVSFGDRTNRYELRRNHGHHHVICTDCGAFEEVDLPDSLGIIERAISKKTTFDITRHALEFFGLCPSCK